MEVKREGNRLTITVELTDNPQPSSSGKTLMLYTTHGFLWQPDGTGISLNIVKHK